VFIVLRLAFLAPGVAEQDMADSSVAPTLRHLARTNFGSHPFSPVTLIIKSAILFAIAVNYLWIFFICWLLWRGMSYLWQGAMSVL
jgi:hypothetical protein